MEKIIKLKYTIPKGINGLNMMAIGDSHKGNRFHDKTMFEIYIDWLYKHKEFKLITMGDLIECATKRSVGLSDQVLPVMDQIEYIIKKLEPIAKEGRIIGMLNGNHEKRAMKDGSIDVTEIFANALNTRNLSSGAVLYLSVKNEGLKRGQNYTIYGTHGSSSARTAGGKMNACMRLRDIVDADLYLHGHVHSLDHHTEDIFTVDRGALRLKRKHYVLTGSYLRYWGSYAQEKGYAPSGTSGSPKIKFHSDYKRISVKL